MKWYDPKRKKPKRFAPLLLYLPGDAPLQTVYEGYWSGDDVWCVNGGLRISQADVVRWADMPEYDSAGDADEDDYNESR